MATRTLNAVFLLLFSGLMACSTPELDSAFVEQADTLVLTHGTPENVAVITFLNDRSTSFDILFDEVGLGWGTAAKLVSHRDGADGARYTPDDAPFKDMRDAASVAFLDSMDIALLLDYVLNHGLLPIGNDLLGIFEGIPFTVSEAVATLAIANSADIGTFIDEAHLSRSAAESIIKARDYVSIPQLAGQARIGPVALAHLRDFACSSLSLDH